MESKDPKGVVGVSILASYPYEVQLMGNVITRVLMSIYTLGRAYGCVGVTTRTTCIASCVYVCMYVYTCTPLGSLCSM